MNMGIIKSLMIALSICIPIEADSVMPEERYVDALVEKTMNWVLPSVEIKNMDLVEAMKYLENKSRDVDPERKGVKIIVVPRGSIPLPGEITARKVSVEMRDIEFLLALKVVINKYSMIMKIAGPDAIVVKSQFDEG